jgi:hypothetical protein
LKILSIAKRGHFDCARYILRRGGLFTFVRFGEMRLISGEVRKYKRQGFNLCPCTNCFCGRVSNRLNAYISPIICSLSIGKFGLSMPKYCLYIMRLFGFVHRLIIAPDKVETPRRIRLDV